MCLAQHISDRVYKQIREKLTVFPYQRSYANIGMVARVGAILLSTCNF